MGKGKEEYLALLGLLSIFGRQFAFTWCLVGWPTTISSPIMEPRKKSAAALKTCNTKRNNFFSFNGKQRDLESGLKM
jgi:hypothetical protein